MPDDTLDTQSLLNIADRLSAAEQKTLYQAGYDDGFHDRRSSEALDNYHGDCPLAASDVYLAGYTAGKAASKQQSN
jgi:hypothetical protein